MFLGLFASGSIGCGSTKCPQIPAPVHAAPMHAAPKRCEQAGDLLPTSDGAVLREHLVNRQWLYCSGPSMFGVKHDGLELHASGNWYYLRFKDDHTLERIRGFDSGGTWSLLGTQLDLHVGGGTNMGHVQVQSNPSAFVWDTNPLGRVRYVAAQP